MWTRLYSIWHISASKNATLSSCFIILSPIWNNLNLHRSMWNKLALAVVRDWSHDSEQLKWSCSPLKSFNSTVTARTPQEKTPVRVEDCSSNPRRPGPETKCIQKWLCHWSTCNRAWKQSFSSPSYVSLGYLLPQKMKVEDSTMESIIWLSRLKSTCQLDGVENNELSFNMGFRETSKTMLNFQRMHVNFNWPWIVDALGLGKCLHVQNCLNHFKPISIY